MDHQRNSRNIKSTGGNIRGNQHTCSISSKKFWRNLCHESPHHPSMTGKPETKDYRRLQEIPKLTSSTCVLHHGSNFSLILCLSVLFLGFRWSHLGELSRDITGSVAYALGLEHTSFEDLPIKHRDGFVTLPEHKSWATNEKLLGLSDDPAAPALAQYHTSTAICTSIQIHPNTA